MKEQMKYFVLTILLLGSMTAQAQTVTMPDGSTRPLGDMDGDGEVNISDVTALVNKILGKTPVPEPEPEPEPTLVPVLVCSDDHHPHLIDLGLPSGTLWSCCNVGASSPEDYGDYYAWGDTQTKDVYNNDTYQYYQDGSFVDIGFDIAGTLYDAATANWGAPWQMPTKGDFEELLNHTTSTWITKNGVNGREFKGDNGGILFLPAAGSYSNGGLGLEGARGYYWSSSLYEGSPGYAYCFSFRSGNVGCGDYVSSGGRNVRPVYKK